MPVTVVAGLTIRFVPLGLSPFIVKYGGSMLWALIIYWIVSTLLYSWRTLTVALLTGVLAIAIEFFKLFHSPAMDALRLTLPGILILGRVFSFWDILAYWVAISFGVLLDLSIRKTPTF